MERQDLSEAFRSCGADLRDRETFLRFYIARSDGASLELTERMLMDPRPVKALFAGQGGTGKTTELVRAVRDCAEGLLPVLVPVESAGGGPGAGDIMAQVGQGICRRLSEAKVALSDGTSRAVASWFKEALKVPGDEKGGLQGTADLFARLLERLRRKDTRSEIASALDARKEELAARIDDIAQEAASRSGRGMLLVIDGLEALDQGTAVTFLLESGLLGFKFKCICTVPYPVLHSPVFRTLRQRFDIMALQPLVDISPSQRPFRPGGSADLRDILDKRLGADLIDPQAVELLILSSGGNPGDLLKLAGSACIKARTRGRARIDPATVEEVLEDHRMEMRRYLSRDEWDRLSQIHTEKDAVEDELLNTLLDTGAVLEHPGQQQMYQVHPALVPVLRNYSRP